jgi:cell division protein FtsA
MAQDKKMATAIDIGSDKVLCLIGSISDDSIIVKGVGHQKSFGISAGVITDLKLAQKSIVSAVSSAEKMAGFNIKKVVINLGGRYLNSSFISAEINVSDKIRKESLSEMAENIIVEYRKNNQEVLHLVPIEYIVDKNLRIENPIGISGNILAVKFHVVSYPTNQIKNIESCLKKYQLTIKNYVSSPYSAALAFLTENEKKIGTLLLDIGGEETSFSIFYNNKFMYNGSVPLGGYNITRDIANVLDINTSTAEKIKTLNVDFTLNDFEEDELIKMHVDDDESFRIAKNKIKLVNNVSKSRIEETLNIVFTLIKKKRLRDKINRIVLAGGTSVIPGIDTFIEETTNVPTRLGSIKNDVIIENVNNSIFRSTIYSTAVGMLIFVRTILKKSKLNDFKSDGNVITKTIINTLKWFIS